MFVYLRTSFPERVEAIVPVPLHRMRAWERTFNQAELLARHVSRLLGVPVWKALRKPKSTASQSSLSGIARRANLKGAFVLKKDGRRRHSVLLIDDVVTTGATLQECARVLRKSAGVKKVYALTVARAVQQF
jgi:ComF family protein